MKLPLEFSVTFPFAGFVPITAVSGAASYRVYRNGTQVGTSSTATYTDTGLTPGEVSLLRAAREDEAVIHLFLDYQIKKLTQDLRAALALAEQDILDDGIGIDVLSVEGGN